MWRSFSQVLLWTKRKCLLLTTAMRVQKGSASSTTSGLSWTMNKELIIWQKLCGCERKPFLWFTDTLIVIATTMHGSNSGISLGSGVPEALSSCVLIDFPQKTLDPTTLPPFSTLHYRISLTSVCEAWATYNQSESATLTVWKQERRHPSNSWQTNSSSVPYARSYFDLGKLKRVKLVSPSCVFLIYTRK